MAFTLCLFSSTLTTPMATKCSLFLLSLYLLLISFPGNMMGFSFDGKRFADRVAYVEGNFVHHLCISTKELKQLRDALPLFKSKIQDFPSYLNVSCILVSSDEIIPIGSFKLDKKVKVATMFSTPHLKTLCQKHVPNFCKVIKFLRRSESLMVVEIPIDQLGQSIAKMGMSNKDPLNYFDMTLVVKIHPSIAQVSVYEVPLANLLAEPSKTSIGETNVGKEQEQIHLPSHRKLLSKHHKHKTRKTQHDLMPPITNPVTTPITPSGFVTIPTADPVTVLPTPITVPSTSPNTVPPQPEIPVTNPITSPTPNYQNKPTSSQGTWCVAKNGVPSDQLQVALDYACGTGGVDCSVIQEGGSCYEPNTLRDHASYAFNSYYQKNPNPESCEFGGTSALVNSNPIACSSPTAIPTPVSVPATNTSTPITVPDNMPQPSLPPPVVTPITTPVTTPIVSLPPPNLNPTLPPPSGGNIPVSSGNSGQTWCVAKKDASDSALQIAVDYACGMGGADCSAIQQNGNCYSPNTLRDHASYAFNSYYQKNSAPTSCDFEGIATLVNTDPSSGSCTYPSSASSSSSTPNGALPTTVTPTTNGETPQTAGTTTVIGPTNPLGPSSPFGLESPTTNTTSGSHSGPSTSSFLFLGLVTTLMYFN